MEKKICRIVGAAPFEPASFSCGDGDFVIAADGGLNALSSLGINPSLCLGDFDSLGYTPEKSEKHPAEKDETDMFLAARRAAELGYNVFYIYGGLGGRLSHTLGNIQVLKFIAENGGAGFLIGSGCVVTLVENGAASFPPGCSGLLSVLCFGGVAEGVDISGMKYPLDNYTMLPSFPIGVSNAFTGTEARVSVKRGTLVLLWEDSYADAEKIALEK
ncbi:MAG: thiamine diphosphokinase [Oscillospiraceae bacterium]|nr:thiamine diphosphokinase [Oscillospiraceae bacterium]